MNFHTLTTLTRVRRYKNRLAGLTHDWRVKILVPVVLINILAFAALYALMFHFAISNLIARQNDVARAIFEHLDLDYADASIEHHGAKFDSRLQKQALLHRLTTLSIFDRNGNLVSTTGLRPGKVNFGQVRRALGSDSEDPAWNIGRRKFATFTRGVASEPRCRTCHPNQNHIGVVQLGIDLSDSLHAAEARVRSRFALAGIAWLGLLGMMFWTGGVVIGRPLAQMERSLKSATGEGDSKHHDLDELASRLHGTVWDVINKQRLREENMARQLVRARQLASLGEIAAGLTHEIKNPVAGVLAALELLLEEEGVRCDRRDVLQQMVGELRRASTTLESLLRLARPQPPHRAAVDMAQIAREVASLFNARLRRAGVALEIEVPQPIPILPLDSGLMVQLLVNLLTNSMQATERGGRIIILIAPFPRRDGVVLAVTDTGRGIGPDVIERVFDPFFTTREEGTGLGLAICRMIVQQHGGTISIESEAGAGARVVVLLPHLDAPSQSKIVEGADGTAAAG